MPPAPRAATISYAPSLVPAERSILGANYSATSSNLRAPASLLPHDKTTRSPVAGKLEAPLAIGARLWVDDGLPFHNPGYGRVADHPSTIVAFAATCCAGIITRTYGSPPWHETRPLRNSVSAGSRGHGRSVSRARYPARPRGGDQDSASSSR